MPSTEFNSWNYIALLIVLEITEGSYGNAAVAKKRQQKLFKS